MTVRLSNYKQPTRFILTFLIFAILMSLSPDNCQAGPLTRKQAVKILIEKVIEPSPDKSLIMAFGPQKPLQPGDLVEPVRDEAGPFPVTPRKLDKATWFFWIDDESDAKFAHPTRFVYIDANHPDPSLGDGIIVDPQGLWPKINGKSYLGGEYERFFVTKDRVYGKPPPTTY